MYNIRPLRIYYLASMRVLQTISYAVIADGLDYKTSDETEEPEQR